MAKSGAHGMVLNSTLKIVNICPVSPHTETTKRKYGGRTTIK
jgi:hypothetical protein